MAAMGRCYSASFTIPPVAAVSHLTLAAAEDSYIVHARCQEEERKQVIV